ncbi:hypothetical protein Pint_22100 [Pistacia integerrima]|uniref:Uncharacterized protein n=1 Tax=Pistacia integerrima TaxID=434235 RepID=A0ACC0YPB9_9ROSI|nr:hypothetical protein Pint_22100 [Pistacia integerrima]
MGMRILFNFRLICNGGIILFTAAMLIELVLSEDQSKYEACAPINCGLGPNISYPFYVKDAGEEFCGHPVPRDEAVNWSRIACEYLVTAPVQLEESEVNRTIYSFDYVKLLKDGFTLKWTGRSCAGCRNSGGRCGFEEDKNVCFWP